MQICHVTAVCSPTHMETRGMFYRHSAHLDRTGDFISYKEQLIVYIKDVHTPVIAHIEQDQL